MIEVGGVAIMDARDVDSSSLELVDKCLVVIGTHGGPALVLDFVIKRDY
jgi:hypothetical protein